MTGWLDQAQFYAILDTAYVPHEQLEPVCRALLAGGADLVQFRAKRETAQVRQELLERLLPLFQENAPHALRLILNDDVELARRYPGVGAHVGQDDLPVAEARARLGADRILGLSTHSLDQARAAIALGPGVLSYFAVGPLFATQTKPDYAPVGLDLPRAVGQLAPAIPFFCIGGINRRTINRVAAAGLCRVVAVSDVLLDPDPAAVIGQIKAALPPLPTSR